MNILPPLPNFSWVKDKVWQLEHVMERRRADEDISSKVQMRISWMTLGFGALYLLLAGFAVNRALFPADEVRQRAGLTGPVYDRADLVDRNGQLLAADLVHYRLFLDPNDMVEQDRAMVASALQRALPQLPPERIVKAYNEDRRLTLIGGLTPAERKAVHDLGLPGVTFEEEGKRVYPLGPTGAHYLGFVDKGGMGLAGVERALQKQIREAGRHGGQVELAMDIRVQGALQNEMRGAAERFQAIGAMGIVTNVQSGEILAMASWPEYDPNAPGAFAENNKRNRVASSVYEMGSTFKMFSVAAGIDSGVATLDSTFDATTPLAIGDRRISDYHAANRVMTLREVFLHSSNIGTSRLAIAIGKDRMVDYYDRFGFLAPAQSDLFESARPITPKRWSENTIASVSFGHAISVTPLAVAEAAGALANGGRMVPLTLLKRPKGYHPEGRQILKPDTSRQILDLLRYNAVAGTGTRANAPGLRVGGKTGSAEKAIGGRYQRDKVLASFAAVFPTDGPLEQDRYLVLIILDQPVGTKESFGLRTAGFNAGPAVGRVIDRIAPFVGVMRRIESPASMSNLNQAPLIQETQTGGGQ